MDKDAQLDTLGRQPVKQIKSHRRRSNRVSVLLTAGAMGLAGAAVMSIPTVYADPIPTGGPTVRFDGGCLLGLGAASSSQPDQGAVSVPAGGIVTIVNEMNADGYVTMGTARITVPEGGSRGFRVNTGPQDLKLVPQCTVGGLLPNHKAVHITVTAPAPAPPAESKPVPPADDKKSTTPAKPGAPAAGDRPEAPADDPKARDGVPPGDDAVPPADPATQPDATDETEEAVPPATDGDDSRNAEAVQPLDSKPASNQSSSLLALIATVCLVGVAAAAIRAIVAHRSMRTANI